MWNKGSIGNLYEGEIFMTRTITIKGVGKLSLKPDQVVVSLTLNATDKNYDKTMDTFGATPGSACWYWFYKG